MTKDNTEPCGDFGMLVMSIDSRKFKPDFVKCALPKLVARHKRFLVVVADDLMIYNRYGIDEDPYRLSRLFEKYWHDRSCFLAKLLGKARIEEKVSVVRYGDYCDQRFSTLWRRFTRIVLSDPKLSRVIDSKVREFLERGRRSHGSESIEELRRSSEAYLLDETVWALHMAANHGVTDQYYPGDVGQVLRFLYDYDKEKGFMALLGVGPHRHGFWNVCCAENDLEFDASSWISQVSHDRSGSTGHPIGVSSVGNG